MFDRILIPLDGSKLSKQAIKPALDLATQEPHSEIILFRVPHFDYTDYSMGMAYSEIAVQREVSGVHDYLEGVQRQLIASDEVETVIKVGAGDPASAIVDLANDEKSDLIVMSTHGRSGLTRWVMGSVTERVLRHAPCPVLTVRSEKPVHHIVIALDGSELAESALLPGLELANRFDAEVTIISVEDFMPVTAKELEFAGNLDNVEPGLGEQVILAKYHKAADYQERLMNQHSLIRQRLPEKTNFQVLSGDPAAAILNFAESQDVDLVVMATHGRTGLRRWRYGSVTEKVLRHAPGSMLIVRPNIKEN